MFGTLLKKRDFYAGGLMTLLGAASHARFSATYTLGTLTHLGPGMFPLMLGATLTFIGVLILGTAVVSPLTDNENILPKTEGINGAAGPASWPARSFVIVLGEYISAWSPPLSAVCSCRRSVTALRA